MKMTRRERMSRVLKMHGFKSMSELAEITGRQRQTLTAWFDNEPELFQIVITGAKKKRDPKPQGGMFRCSCGLEHSLEVKE